MYARRSDRGPILGLYVDTDTAAAVGVTRQKRTMDNDSPTYIVAALKGFWGSDLRRNREEQNFPYVCTSFSKSA